MTMLARLLAMLLLLTGTGLVGAAPASGAGKPSAPRAVAAVAGDRTATLTWKAPARRGGSKVRAYGVQRRSGASWTTVATVSGGRLSWQATGLSNGQPSDYRVRARNGSGWGRPSAAVRITPRAVPGVPALTEADGYGSALGVYWRAPAGNGAPIDYYRVEISTDGVTWTDGRDTPTAASSAQPLMVAGLTPGSRYRVRVRAHNAAGFGDGGQAGPYRVYAGSGPVLAPSATSGDGQVDLSWSAPAVPPAPEGLLAAAQYLVESSTDGGATWAVVGQSATTSYLATGLTNGTTYRFRISARPSARYPYGPATVVLADAPTGPGGLPPGPVTFSAPVLTHTSATSYTVALAWSAPVTGVVTDYLVQRSTAGGEFTDLATTDAGVYDDTGAGPLTSYIYRVVARGPAGSGAPTDLPVTTGEAYQLSAPATSVPVAEGADAALTLTIDVPAAADVVLTLASDSAAVTVPATATIAPGETSVEVQVSGVPDLDLADESATVTVALGTHQHTVEVQVTDDDVQTLVVDPATPIDLGSPGDSVTVHVRLAFEPTGTAAVTLSYSGAEAELSTPQLSFDAGNWSVDQSFTITKTGNNETGTLTISTPGASPVQLQVTT